MSAPAPPPAYTPLIALPVLVLDLETTGLDVRTDRIVQIGAIPMQGEAIDEDAVLDRLVDPGVPIPARSTAIHGVDDARVAGAPGFADLAPQLFALLAGRCVVGHHVGFDLAMLRHEAERAGTGWTDVPMLDLAQLVGALEPQLRDLELGSVMTALGVEVEGRHSAIGDCRAIALAWTRLQPLLRKAGVRTLGEAQALCARRGDIGRNEAEAGWVTVTDTALRAAAVEIPSVRIDRYAFERQLSELMRSPPLVVDPDTTLREAAGTMTRNRVGALLVGHPGQAPMGILTERDLLRIVAHDANELDTTAVSVVMSAPVACMGADELLYRALARMDRLGIRHLCIVDQTGVPQGMVSQRDLLQHRARGADMLSDALVAADDLPALATAYARLPGVASRLISEGVSGPAVARIVSLELRTLMKQVTELAADRLQALGHGSAPAPWCLLVLGSGGRGESLLAADQDNALIHAGTPADDPWFAEFGAVIAELLDAAGVRRCPGGVMASNREWRGTLEEWTQRVDSWLARPRLRDLLKVDLFFDQTVVAGNAELARDLHESATRRAATLPDFIGVLTESAKAFAPRFNLFGGLVRSDGRIDLKRDALLALVKVARTLALRVGSTSRTTPDRLRDAMLARRLPEGDAAALSELHAHLLTLVLNQQIADLQDGIPPSGKIVLKTLERKRRARLHHGLQALDMILRSLRTAVSG